MNMNSSGIIRDLDELVAQIQEAEANGETWDTLQERLKTAREAHDEAKTAQGKLENIELQQENAKKERDTIIEELRAFTEKLTSFGGGSVDRGLKEVVERFNARRLACQLEEELTRDHPDLDELKAQIQKVGADGETWDSLEERLTVLKESLRELDEQYLEQQKAIAKLGAEIDSIQKEETANQVQGEIEIVEAQILDTKESRDRLFLLARLVQEADRRFRKEHQPALLKQAGKYVDQITGGRYDQIVIGETRDKFFSLRDPASSQLRKMSDPYSQGTKEQIYFALRLAAIDHLDGDRERPSTVLGRSLRELGPATSKPGLRTRGAGGTPTPSILLHLPRGHGHHVGRFWRHDRRPVGAERPVDGPSHAQGPGSTMILFPNRGFRSGCTGSGFLDKGTA